MKCPVCTASADEGAAFCQQCGAKLPVAAGGGAIGTSTSASPADSGKGSPAGNDSASGAASSGRRRGVIDVPEETLWEGSFSPKAMIGSAVLCGLLGIAIVIAGVMLSYVAWSFLLVLVVWLVWLGRLVTRRLGISYKLTNQMFYHRSGVLTRVTDRIELIEVHDVTYEQGLLQRLVNVGRIKIASSDRTDPVLYLPGVEDVENVAKLIDKARRGEQVRRGRRIDFSQIDGET